MNSRSGAGAFPIPCRRSLTTERRKPSPSATDRKYRIASKRASFAMCGECVVTTNCTGQGRFSLSCDTNALVIRSEEHTSELQSLMRISYAVFCLKKKIIRLTKKQHNHKHKTHKIHQTQQYQYI